MFITGLMLNFDEANNISAAMMQTVNQGIMNILNST